MGSGSPLSLGPGRRCERHALAAGPDGLCALCRSESLPPSRAYSTWVLGGLLLAILFVSGGVVAYRAVTGLAHAAITQEPTGQRSAAEIEGNAPGAPAAAPAAVAVVIVEDPAAGGDSIPLVEAVPEPALPALAPAAAAAPEPAAQAAEAAEAIEGPGKPAPSQAQLQAALSATPIVMYSASWCGVCRQAKRFFSENGLRYQEIDADTTPGAWDKVEQLIGRRAVPVVMVDGKLASAGLSPSSIMNAVSQSMERRLGVRGIRFKSD